MRLEIRRSRSTALAVVLLLFGIPFAVAIPVLLLIAILERDAGALGASTVAALLAFEFVPAGVAAWHLARSQPALVVTEDGVTIEDPGLFARPVHLSRPEVHSVYVRPFPEGGGPPHFYGRDALRRLRRWHESQPTVPVSSLHCPDLSLLPLSGTRNLLIVVAHSMPMKGFGRRGLGSLGVVLAPIGFHGPTRESVARGFFASVLEEEQARQAFASYPTADAPDPELWDWLHARTDRSQQTT